MKKINVTPALDAMKLVQQTRLDLGQKQVELRSTRAQLEAEIVKALDAPLRRDEAKAVMVAMVDRMADQFLRLSQAGKVFNAFAYPAGERSPGFMRGVGVGRKQHNGPLSLADVEEINHAGSDASGMTRIFDLNGVDFFNGAADDSPPLKSARAAFFFGDIIKEKLERHFEHQFPDIRGENSPTLEERRDTVHAHTARIAEIDAELLNIEGQLDELSKGLKGR